MEHKSGKHIEPIYIHVAQQWVWCLTKIKLLNYLIPVNGVDKLEKLTEQRHPLAEKN